MKRLFIVVPILMLCALVFGQDYEVLHPGKNPIKHNDLTFFAAADTSDYATPAETLWSAVYTSNYSPTVRGYPANGPMSIDVQLDSVRDSIVVDVLLQEGNYIDDWNLTTSIVSKSCAVATWDTTVEFNLLPACYFRIGYYNYGNGTDSFAVDSGMIYVQPE